MKSKQNDINQVFHGLENVLPGFFLILELDDFSIKYLSKNGRETIQKNLDETVRMSIDDIKKYLDPGLSERMYAMMQQSVDEKMREFGFFFKARVSLDANFEWYHATLKPDYNNNLIYTIIQPVSTNLDHINLILNKFLDHGMTGMDGKKVQNLSEREKQVLKLAVQGHTSSDIGEMLYISKCTVDNHRKNIIKKLHIKSISELRNLTHILE